MKKLLATSLLIIIEAGIDVPAKRIRKSGRRNGNTDGLRHLSGGDGDYDLLDDSLVILAMWISDNKDFSFKFAAFQITLEMRTSSPCEWIRAEVLPCAQKCRQMQTLNVA